MRKLIILFILLISSAWVFSQTIPADRVIIRNSLILKDSTVTATYGGTLVNKTYADQYAPGGSSGDIQYKNGTSFDGAPMTTDGTDITVTNDLGVTTSLTVGFSIDNSISIPSVLDHSFLTNPLNTYPLDFHNIGTGSNSVYFRLAFGKFYYFTSTSGGQSSIKIDQTASPYFKTRIISGGSTSDIIAGSLTNYRPSVTLRGFVGTDSLLSEFIRVDTGSFIIEINGDIDNPDPQYKFYEDSFVNETNMIIKGYINNSRYEAAAYLSPDSTITTSLTTAWIFLGDGQNNKFTNIDIEGFSFDGDTLQFDQRVNDTRDSIEFHISYSCENATSSINETIYNGIFIKNSGGSSYTEVPQCTRRSRTATAAIFYPGPTLSPMPIWLKDGDKIQIQAKVETGTTTLSTQTFGIYLYEE